MTNGNSFVTKASDYDGPLYEVEHENGQHLMFAQWNAWYLKSGVMTTGVEDYLLWHWFGNVCTTPF